MRNWRLVLGACALVTVMVGCGGDDDGVDPGDAGGGGGDAGVMTDSGPPGEDSGTPPGDAGMGGDDAGGGGSDAGTDAGGGGEVSFAAQVWPILTERCTGCHGGSGGLALGTTAASAHAALVGPNRVRMAGCSGATERVTPGSPEQSFLMQKLEEEVPANCGDRMPRGSALPDAQIDIIRTWIEQGAQNN